MRMWIHLLSIFVILPITYVSSDSSEAAPTPYLIIMAKTLYQKSLHYIFFVYNNLPGSQYAVQIDSINPFSGAVKTGEIKYSGYITYRIPFENYQEESIRLNMTIFSCSERRVCKTRIARDSRILPVIVDPSVNLIQISRSHYHRNETVQFRVISYVSNTVALLRGKFNKIYIEDSKAQRVEQWVNVTLLQALEGLNFTLGQKAALGKWRVNLVLEQIVDYEEFYVNDVKRPMFTVELKQPKYLRLDAKHFSFKVCAEYPYVETMEASIEGSFCIEERRLVDLTQRGKPIKNCVTIKRGASDIKECSAFLKINTEKLKLDEILRKRIILPYPLLKSVLNVTVKQLNGYYEQRSATGEVGNHQMKIVVECPSFYKPGLPYQGTVFVGSMDDRPIVDAEVRVTPKPVEDKMKLLLHGSTYRTDKQGSFRFGLPPMSQNVGNIELSFEVVNHTELSSDHRMRKPKVTKILKASVSKIGAFLQLEVDEDSCSSKARTIPFTIRSTVSFGEQDVRAAVISERNFTSYYTFSNTPMPEKCEDADDPLLGHYKCVKDQRIKCLDGWYGDNCLTSCSKEQQPCASKSSRKSLESLTFYTRKGRLDVTETWHRSTQLVIWAQVTRNKITEIITDKVSFKKADKCSLPIASPGIGLKSTSVEQGSQMVMSISGVNSTEMRCSLSVIRDCKVGCRDDVNDINSEEKLNKLVAEYVAWCHDSIDRSVSDNAMERDFNNAGFTIASNFPVDRNSRIRRSAILREKRLAKSPPQSMAKPSFFKKTMASKWNFQTFRGPRKELKFKAPSTPGKWRAQILCVSPRGIRVSPAAKFMVEKLVQLETSLPVSFKVGETYNIPISLMFSGKMSAKVILRATVSKNTKLDLTSHNEFHWKKPKQKIINIKVTPLQAGTMILVLNATATSENGYSFYDPIEEAITIEPKGTTKIESFEHVSCKGRSGSFKIPPPKVGVGKIVGGSQKVAVFFSGNVVGSKISNLINLMRAPHGLSERNLGILSVNLNILQYYMAIGYKNEKVLRRLQNFIREGCQNQLRYRRPDGSFAYNDNINVTSTWFTTLVFTTLYRSKMASKQVQIDDSVLKSALGFILSRQNKDGCFNEGGDVNLFSLAGGFLREQRNPRLLTAFVLYSLQAVLETGSFQGKIGPALATAFGCLKSKSTSPADLNIHSLAVVARALATYSSSDPLTKRALDELQKRKNRRGEESFWLTENRDKPYWNERLASDVETTSHAVLAQLRMKKVEALADVVPALKWLVGRRNSFKWYTYIDRAAALRALTEAAIISDAKGNFDPTLDMQGYDGEKEKFKIRQSFNVDTRDLVMQSVYASSISKLNYERLGKGCVLIVIHRYYNVL